MPSLSPSNRSRFKSSARRAAPQSIPEQQVKAFVPTQEKWRASVLDLHRVLNVVFYLFLLLEEHSEPIIRVALELVTDSSCKRVLRWHREDWHDDDDKRDWFKKAVWDKLDHVLQMRGIFSRSKPGFRSTKCPKCGSSGFPQGKRSEEDLLQKLREAEAKAREAEAKVAESGSSLSQAREAQEQRRGLQARADAAESRVEAAEAKAVEAQAAAAKAAEAAQAQAMAAEAQAKAAGAQVRAAEERAATLEAQLNNLRAEAAAALARAKASEAKFAHGQESGEPQQRRQESVGIQTTEGFFSQGPDAERRRVASVAVGESLMRADGDDKATSCIKELEATLQRERAENQAREAALKDKLKSAKEDNGRLREVVEELTKRVQKLSSRKDAPCDPEIAKVNKLLTESGLDSTEKKSVWDKLYDDAKQRVQRLEKMRRERQRIQLESQQSLDRIPEESDLAHMGSSACPSPRLLEEQHAFASAVPQSRGRSSSFSSLSRHAEQQTFGRAVLQGQDRETPGAESFPSSSSRVLQGHGVRGAVPAQLPTVILGLTQAVTPDRPSRWPALQYGQRGRPFNEGESSNEGDPPGSADFAAVVKGRFTAGGHLQGTALARPQQASPLQQSFAGVVQSHRMARKVVNCQIGDHGGRKNTSDRVGNRPMGTSVSMPQLSSSSQTKSRYPVGD